MFYDSYHDDREADEAAEEARRVEMAAIAAVEGFAGWDWEEEDAAQDAARNEAALIEAEAELNMDWDPDGIWEA
jgi:hypothetical protein